ncbi:hypothetical protein ANCDUO_22661 [Ancylostoma duodenale]|uniref:Uncharacterized protein n=1 Tax=Ancylostoma duodenale TaxID=51022 RepID=A0A0C2FQR8_9BILA|nr:hypothetical protein ANCDUO_22661 [Ancylostoma duodenale]
MNLIALAIFVSLLSLLLSTFNEELVKLQTLAAGYLTMAATSAYDVQSVLMALCMTTGSSAAIIVFAIFVRKDLTTCIGIAYVLSMTMMFFGIVALVACLGFRVTFLYTVYAALGALLSMLYLAIDIQVRI